MPHAGGPWLEEAVRSVLGQSYTPLELIIIDDASGAADVIRRLAARDARVKPIFLPTRQGASKARASGIETAQGRWIAFCDSDDVWVPHKLEVQLADANAARAEISCTAYQRISEDGSVLDKPIMPPRTMSYTDLLRGCPIGCSTAMYDTESVGKVYPPNVPMRVDYGLWLKILRAGGRAVAMQEPLVSYRVRRRSVSSNKLRAALWQWRILRREDLSVSEAAQHWAAYVARSIAVRSGRSKHPRLPCRLSPPSVEALNGEDYEAEAPVEARTESSAGARQLTRPRTAGNRSG